MIRFAWLSLIMAVACPPAWGLPRFGAKTQAAWLAKSAGYEPGKPVITALRLNLMRGWHTYWINPGEAGMPLSANLELPEGWTAEPPLHPFPKRFKTGDLHDFGYSGTVWFPIILHPPASASGEVELSGTFAWLNCDESACVPGEATLRIRLAQGASAPSASAASIEKALAQVPIAAPEPWQLEAARKDDSLELKLTLPDSVSPALLDVFPETLNAIDPAATFAWRIQGGQAVALVPKSPFAPPQIESIAIVANHPALNRPVRVTWQQK